MPACALQSLGNHRINDHTGSDLASASCTCCIQGQSTAVSSVRSYIHVRPTGPPLQTAPGIQAQLRLQV